MDNFKQSALRWLNDGVCHFRAIRYGGASQAFSMPGIQQVLDPLQGAAVPANEEELHSRWQNAGVASKVLQAATDNNQTLDVIVRPYLPPQALEKQVQEPTLIEAMIEIGVINRAADSRANMPDLFRVAADIGRHGGVWATRK